MPAKIWKDSLYRGKDASAKSFTVDVTSSISYGLGPSKVLIKEIASWMKQRGCSRILDFGAGALRNTLPLVKQGFDVTAVEFERAYDRPTGKEKMEKAQGAGTFTELLWPTKFIDSDAEYDVVLLAFVLQVVPSKADRERILKEVARKLDRNGPRRLYYASRYETLSDKPERKYKDGYIRKIDQSYQTFYTQWRSKETDEFMKKAKFYKAGTASGADQAWIYELEGGL